MIRQNSKLKKEFVELKQKLEECIEKNKKAKKAQPSKPEPNDKNQGFYFSYLKKLIFNKQRNKKLNPRSKNLIFIKSKYK